ncbi:hypothetical protein PV04_10725 [Phialophora macrospora]|uniref:Uncharacterized protein n=1 Tax=Phialophora macrospora TaxID=1851006 RepID=A0A0D2DJN9_9EURO|nr:hypothetical protein PV04_10725 [Phialophora macrospora]
MSYLIIHDPTLPCPALLCSTKSVRLHPFQCFHQASSSPSADLCTRSALLRSGSSVSPSPTLLLGSKSRRRHFSTWRARHFVQDAQPDLTLRHVVTWNHSRRVLPRRCRRRRPRLPRCQWTCLGRADRQTDRQDPAPDGILVYPPRWHWASACVVVRRGTVSQAIAPSLFMDGVVLTTAGGPKKKPHQVLTSPAPRRSSIRAPRGLPLLPRPFSRASRR